VANVARTSTGMKVAIWRYCQEFRFAKEGGKERMEQELTYLVFGVVPTLISVILLSRIRSFSKRGHPEDAAGSAEEIN
jgi:hypothetical protein